MWLFRYKFQFHCANGCSLLMMMLVNCAFKCIWIYLSVYLYLKNRKNCLNFLWGIIRQAPWHDILLCLYLKNHLACMKNPTTSNEDFWFSISVFFLFCCGKPAGNEILSWVMYENVDWISWNAFSIWRTKQDLKEANWQHHHQQQQE